MSHQDTKKNKRLHETIIKINEYARVHEQARDWLIEWNTKHKLHPSQDDCVNSLAAFLATAPSEQVIVEDGVPKFAPRTVNQADPPQAASAGALSFQQRV